MPGVFRVVAVWWDHDPDVPEVGSYDPSDIPKFERMAQGFMTPRQEHRFAVPIRAEVITFIGHDADRVRIAYAADEEESWRNSFGGDEEDDEAKSALSALVRELHP